MVRGQTHIGLLCSIGADEGVHLPRLDLVKVLHSLLDLPLVRGQINNEHKGVVVLNLLHGTLSGEGEFDDGELILGGDAVGNVACVLGSAL